VCGATLSSLKTMRLPTGLCAGLPYANREVVFCFQPAEITSGYFFKRLMFNHAFDPHELELCCGRRVQLARG
jgi:hypothetical protein